MTEVTPSSYWIASNALYITLNANGDPDYIVGNATSGAQILVYMKGINGLEYDAGHNYRRWPLSLSPTYFGTRTAKYVYVAVPRPGNPVGIATVVFPSERIDIYGKNAQEEQIGSEDFYYIFLQGIISATNAGSTEPRTWQQAVETGTLSSDEALDAGGDNTWWKISTVDDTVHFLKEIVMDAKSFFQNFRLNGHEFVSEAKPGVTPLDSENTIVTPLFGNRHYISKDHDDETQGEIGFLKGLWIKAKNLFGIGESGDALFRNLHLAENADIDGVLRSWAGVFANLLQSSNWTGDGHFDTGFRLMKDAAGVTSMVVDNLFVRMKAIFTELEIRKMSYAGGNIIFSHAGGKIVALAGVTYIKGEAHVIGHTIYLDDAEVVGHKVILPNGAGEFAYRCYMLADDGTTRTQNWWQVDDQARCQTFNIQAGTYQNVSNSFYWRRVVGTGTEVLSDGKTYDYVDLSATDCFTGTSIDGIDVTGFESVPQTGDQLVQMGNRTDASRQGFVTIEVRGEDAPAFKVYKNVSGYSLDGKRKICLSPSLTDLKVQKLTIETEYDAKRVPMERGAWIDICEKDDSGTVLNRHRCYYYNLAQHNGTTWLCIYPEGGVGGVLYTTEEPSATAIYWRAYAEKGEQGASTTVQGEAVAHFSTWASLVAAIQTGVFTPTEGDYILLDSSDGHEEGEDRPSIVEYINGPDQTWSILFPDILEGWIINGYLWVAQETEWHNNGKWQGDDAINIMLTPESIILNQDLQTKAIDLTQAYSDVAVVKGDEPLSNFVVTIGTGADAPVHCNASVSGNRVRITSILSSGGVYYDNGSVTVKITYNGNTYTKVFKFYANLLGTWKETVENDTKTEVARSLSYAYTKEDPQDVKTLEQLGTFIKGSQDYEVNLQSKVLDANGNVVKSSGSLYKQTADAAELAITNKLGETGIHINGNTREIDLIAGKVNFKKANGSTNDNISIDPTTGDVSVSGTINATSGRIGGFNLTEQTMESQSGNLELNGVEGTIKLLQSEGYSWRVLPDGRQVLGVYASDFDYGQHIELDPRNKEIRLYDADGNLTGVFNSARYSSIAELYPTGDDVELVEGSTVSHTHSGIDTAVSAGEEYTHVEDTVLCNISSADKFVLTFLFGAVYTKNFEPLFSKSYQGRVDAGDSFFVLEKFTDDTFTTSEGETELYKSLIEDIPAYTWRTQPISTAEIGGGYYKLHLRTKFLYHHTTAEMTETAQYTVAAVLLSYRRSHSRFFGNGLTIGSSLHQHVSILNNNGSVSFEGAFEDDDHNYKTVKIDKNHLMLSHTDIFGSLLPVVACGTIVWENRDTAYIRSMWVCKDGEKHYYDPRDANPIASVSTFVLDYHQKYGITLTFNTLTHIGGNYMMFVSANACWNNQAGEVRNHLGPIDSYEDWQQELLTYKFYTPGTGNSGLNKNMGGFNFMMVCPSW